MNQIRMRVTPDGDGVWQTHLELCNEDFSRRGRFWGGQESLEAVSSHLIHYPLTREATLHISHNVYRETIECYT